jgi:hypothetical protein
MNKPEIMTPYLSVSAAYAAFKERWEKDPKRKKRKCPGRTQFYEKVWKPVMRERREVMHEQARA